MPTPGSGAQQESGMKIRELLILKEDYRLLFLLKID